MDHYILYPQRTKGAIHATSVAIHACVSKQLVTKGQFTLRFNVEFRIWIIGDVSAHSRLKAYRSTAEFRISYTLPKSKEKEQAE